MIISFLLSGCCRSIFAKKSKNYLQLRVRSHQVMSKPGSKRPKMNELGVTKSKEVRIFDPGATFFETLVKMEAFIDHSNVIKPILEGPTRKCVVAPSRFCKSTNMAMAQSFLEIEIHKDGENYGKAVRDVMREATSVEELRGTNLKNYDLFCVPQPKCKILEDEEFVLKHFGRYPVIKLDLAVELITSFSFALYHCLGVIRRAYEKHTYLLKSNKLNKNDQDQCKTWCSPIRYKEGDDNIKKNNVKTGLANLAKYLHLHFGRKVVLLVDEFDAIMSRAKLDVETDKELTDILNLVIDMLGCDLEGMAADDHVEYVLLTGIESISTLGFSPRLAGVKKYTFLDSEEFFGFYGVEENDLWELITKLKSKGLLPLFEGKEVQQIMEDIMKHYDGYYSRCGKSISILPLWSILHYLQEGKASIHWSKPSVLNYIGPFLKRPSIAAKILQLVGKQAGEETVLVKIPQIIDILQLRELVKKDPEQELSVDLSLFYLKELGYLANVKRDSDEKSEKVELKIANKETWEELFTALVTTNVEIVGFDFTIMEPMANVFYVLLRDITEETFHNHLCKFFETLKTLFTQGLAEFNKVDINESVLISLMLIALSDIRPFKWIPSNHPVKDSKGKYLTTDRSGVDIWMQYLNYDSRQDKINNSVVIFQLKYNTLEYSSTTEEQKRTSLYALKEILGKEDGKKGCVSALNVLKPPKYLLVGLSIDSNFMPSLSCLLNTKDDKKPMCLSETELVKFPAYYEGCVDLLQKQKKGSKE